MLTSIFCGGQRKPSGYNVSVCVVATFIRGTWSSAVVLRDEVPVELTIHQLIQKCVQHNSRTIFARTHAAPGAVPASLTSKLLVCSDKGVALDMGTDLRAFLPEGSEHADGQRAIEHQKPPPEANVFQPKPQTVPPTCPQPLPAQHLTRRQSAPFGSHSALNDMSSVDSVGPSASGAARSPREESCSDIASVLSCENDHEDLRPGETLLYLTFNDDVVFDDMRCVQILRAMYKIKAVKTVLRQSSIAEEFDFSRSPFALDFDDLRAIHHCSYIRDHPKNFDSALHSVLMMPLVKRCARDFEGCDELFRAPLQAYRIGDAVFYNLEIREKMGDSTADGVGASLLNYIQRKYDTYSHSGLVYEVGAENDKVPFISIVHGIKNRRKTIFYPFCALYMPRRRVDFAKVFVGFGALEQTVQDHVQSVFESVLVDKAMKADAYVMQPSGFWETVLRFVSPIPQTTTPTPMEFRPQNDGSEWNASISSLASAASSTPEDTGVAGSTTHMCSGFTSGLIFEVCCEVKLQMCGEEPDLAEAFRFCDAMNVDVTKMTPKDLHRWPIWTECEHMPLARFITPEAAEATRLPLEVSPHV